ncbi:glycosyltransferase 87 family protein [Yinghuangia soli]|uniref:Glycosyltransferase 87 family protein n=1 Tax=Yinghuangia soli TaxID=2908204 RepID=A0AA41U130_9ACTN|nr:glycosyltransferase 87 family protein [Yinghuangia soli]MCF2527072.1 glycosyltransferase 87 family protein [Yinghuangia soli]
MRLVGIGVVLSAVAAYVASTVVWPAYYWMADLRVYRAGGRIVLSAGRPLYDGPVLGLDMEFTYPPFAAVVFAPLAVLPLGLVKVLWIVLCAACLYGTVRIVLARLIGSRHRDIAVLAVLMSGALMFVEPVRSTVSFGQINLLLMLIVVADLTGSRTSRWRGIGVGIATGIKLTPAIFILYLLLARRFRAAAVAGGAFAGTVAVGLLCAPRDSTDYWGGVFLDADRVGYARNVTNQSLRGLMARTFDTDTPPQLLWVLSAAALATLGLALAVRASRQGHEVLGVALCGLTGVVIAPHSWGHHWVWVVPLIVHLAVTAWRSRDRAAGFALAATYLTMLAWPVKMHPIRPSTGIYGLEGLPSWLSVLTENVWVIGFGILLAYFASACRRGRLNVVEPRVPSRNVVAPDRYPAGHVAHPRRRTGRT